MVSWMLSASAVGVFLATFAAGSVDFLADEPRVVSLTATGMMMVATRLQQAAGPTQDFRVLVVCTKIPGHVWNIGELRSIFLFSRGSPLSTQTMIGSLWPGSVW